MNVSSIKYNVVERIIDSYISPNDKNMHKIFMPLSQYPKIHGLIVSEVYKEVIAENINSFNLEFIVKDEKQYDIDLLIGKFTIRLIKDSNDKRCRVYYLNKQIASLPIQTHFTICMRIIERELYLAINERRLFCLNKSIDEFELESLCIKVKNTNIYLLNYQYYNTKWKLQAKDFGYLNDVVSKEVYNTSPKYVLLWEHRSKELYHALLIAYELVNKKFSINSELEEKIYVFADLVFKMLTAWPKWRPSSYTTLGEGGWETNNWCNGYMPGAYALASKILQEENSDDFFYKGLNWLVDKRNIKDISITKKFPPPSHWINRSTNHGIVILSTILVGACILDVFDDERVQLLYEDLKEVINIAFIDGSYLESVSYFQFVILELIPLFHHLSKLNSISYVDIANKDFSSLKKSIDFINAVSNHSTRRFFATYGDCSPGYKWFSTVLLFSIQISNKVNPFHFEFSQDYNELYSLFLLPFDNKPQHLEFCPKNLISYHIFHHNHFVQLKHLNQLNNNEFYLWINGSKLHKTHNRDNDLGSFYLDDNEGSIFVKKQGVDIRNHNVITIKSILIDGEVVSADELNIQEYSSSRNVNGNVEIVQEDKDLYIFKHEARSYFKHNGKPLIKEHVRFYVILKESDFHLIIVDKVISSHKILCEARFHISPDLSFCTNKDDGSLLSRNVKVSSIGHTIELGNSCILNTSSKFSEINMIITSIRSKDSTVNKEDIYSIINNCNLIQI